MRKTLDLLCGLLAALALFGIMLLTLVDVSGRKLLDTSLPGSLELTELLMVIVIFAGLPLVSLHGEHVVFDSLDPWLPRPVRALQSRLVDVVCIGALGGMAWLLWHKAGDMTAYGDTTAQLGIAQGPFVYVMSALCALTALVHVRLLARPVAHHHPGVAEAGGGSGDGAA